MALVDHALNHRVAVVDAWNPDAGRLAEPAQVRLTVPVLMRRMEKIREALGGAAVLKKVRALHGEMDAKERQALAGEIDKVREVLTAIAREVRGR